MLGQGETITLPTFSGEKITKVVYSVYSNASTSASAQLYTSDGTAASASQTQTASGSQTALEVYTDYQSSVLCLKNSSAKSKNVQVKTLTITTETSTACDAPTFSPASQNFDESVEVTLNCTTDGAKIYYTTDGTEPTDASTLYTAPFTLTATTTVKAIAYADGLDASSVATATYTKVEALQGVKGLREQIETDNSSSAQEYTVKLTNAVVTFVNGYTAVIEQDGVGIIFYASNTFSAGDVLNGTATVNGCMYNGNAELTSFSGITPTSGTAPDPTVVTLSQLESDFATYSLRYVKVKGATVASAFSNRNATITDETSDNAFTIRDAYSTAKLTATVGDNVNVTGVSQYYNTSTQILVYQQSDIEVINAPTISLAEGTYLGSQTVSFSFDNANLAMFMYTTDGTDPDYDNNNGTLLDTDKSITIDKSCTVKVVALDNDGKAISNIATATYTISTLTGDGSFENPYTVEDVQAMFIAGGQYPTDDAWVTGYITGAASGISNEKVTVSNTTQSNILLSKNSSSTDYSDIIPVALKNNTAIRDIINVKDNADNIGKEVKVYGTITKYFSMGGINPISKIAGLGSISITSAGYATRYDVCAYEIPEGVQGGIVIDKSMTSGDADLSGTLTIEYQFDATHESDNHHVVPAKAAVLLKGAEGDYDIVYTNSSTSATNTDLHLDKNLLHGGDAVDASGKTSVTGTNVKYYMLSYGTDDLANVLAFYWGEDDGAAFTYPEGKAFLAIDFGTSEAKVSMFSLDGETTGIKTVGTEETGKADAIYTISGQRVGSMTKAGLYIVNGKKVIVK